MTCGAEGSISVLSLVPAAMVRKAEGTEPVMLHLTVCRRHLPGVRSWLRDRRAAVGVDDHPDDVMTYSTELVMQSWGQIQDSMAPTPIWRMTSAV